MNKKFSTLVAALLVSGGSFAMVSQYMGSTLTESPLAVAAAANLRATTTTTETVGYALKVGELAKATTWYLEGSKLHTAEGYKMTDAPALDKNAAGADFVYVDNHLKSGSDYLVFTAEGLALKAAPGVGESYATFFNANNTHQPTTDGVSNYIGKIGAESLTYAIGSNGMKVTAPTLTLAHDANVTDAGVAGLQKAAKLESVSGFLLLKVTTAAGSEKYVVSDGTTITLEDEKPADIRKSVVTYVNNGQVRLGNKNLYYNSGFTFTNPNPGTTGYEVFLTGDERGTSTWAQKPTVGGDTQYHLIVQHPTSITNALTGSWNITYKADGASVEDVANTAATELTVEAVESDGFTLSTGIGYLKDDAEAGEKIEAAKFTLDADGAVKCGHDYLQRTSTGGYIVATLSASNEKVYLYSARTANAAPLTTVEAGTVYAATTDVTVNGAATVAYADPKTETTTTTEPDWTPMTLEDGASYYIGNGNSYLCLNTKGDKLAVSSEGELWKVSVVDAGAGKLYSFTNQYGQALAFNVSDAGVVTYAADGKYSQFYVNKWGEITFEAGDTYEVTIASTGVTMPKYTEYAQAEQNKFAEAEIEEVDNISDAVKLLNKTYGTGNGFGLMFKDNAITADKVKDMTLESNPFSDASLITAVEGKDLSSSLRATNVDRADLSDNMFLKVSGSYPLTNAQLDAMGANTPEKKANAQIDAFRASNFIAVDTVRYSSLVPDYNDQNNFFKYVTVSGASMLSQKGYVFDNNAVDADFGRSGALEGVTRRIENAAFTLEQIQGGTVTDAIQLVVDAYMPKVDNGEKYGVKGHTESVNDLYITIKNFNGKNYLGAGPVANAWDYVYVGMNNDVDYKTINGIVTLISRNYDTDGQVYASPYFNADRLKTVLPKYVSTDKPEGQYLVTGGNTENGRFQPFTFTNRESGAYMTINGLKKTDVANVYATADGDTIEIKAASTANEFVGYANYDANVLANTQYVLKVVSNAAGIKDIYIAEDHNKDHSLGLNADTLEAANFKLIKFERAANKAKYIDYGDTVFVNQNAYSYIAVDKKTKEEYYDVAEDRVVAFTYAIYNADNGEYLDVNYGQGTTVAQYFYCNPNKKYGKTADKDIQRFIIKEKANGAVQLIPVGLHNSDFEGSVTAGAPEKVQFTEKADYKLYAGISDNKIYEEYSIYKIADNDLFTIQQIGAPLYRTLDVTGNVRIFKEGMPNIALFAESADKALVSGQNLLGMEHKADADLEKTMFSFMLDTAYVDRANNYTPQYLLAIDATTTPGGKWCETHQSATCEHAVEIPGYVKGSYLVSLADSAAAVAASQAHKNPYMYDGYNRLGFVKATHIGDALAIERGKAVKADTLSLKNGLTKASFALRIVDQATQSFALQNADGYVKWLNGVPVLVGNFDQAEVLNIEATENAATANEAIAAEGVQVIAGKGVVTVQGAAGKVITVANILGQTIANQVAASDNVTIAAPAGVVVVAVDGEATKVVVK